MANNCITLKQVSSFFIGGHNQTVEGFDSFEFSFAKNGNARIVNPNGNYEEGQMYVQHYQQMTPRSNYPILFWHGGGMTGSLWESTADGGPGWLNFFLSSGFDIFITDCANRGRSGFSPITMRDAQPFFRSKEECWQFFRIGQAKQYHSRIPFDPTQFPIFYFDNYCQHFVVRYEHNLVQVENSYLRLLEYSSKSIIIAHSQGGGFALEACTILPEKVQAVIVIEPSGSPDFSESVDINKLKEVPHLFVWGDHIEMNPLWVKYKEQVDSYALWLKNQGVPVTIINLPDLNIYGNTHALMNDINAEQIATTILNWIVTKELL